MRFYLVKIAYNKVAQAEDRTIGGYNTLDEAIKAFHSYMYQNVLGSTIGWCYASIVNENGEKIMDEKWGEVLTTQTDVTALVNKYVIDNGLGLTTDYIDQVLNDYIFNVQTP